MTQPIENTPEGRLIVSVKAYVAEVERLKIIDRVQRGRRGKLRSGKLAGQGNELYGYRKDKTAWTRKIYEPEAAVVREIFKMAAAGRSRRSIAIELTNRGVPTPSKSMNQKRVAPNWHPPTITGIVRNSAYKGEDYALQWVLKEDGKRVMRRNNENAIALPNAAPVIVDAELWEAANAAFNKTASADNTRNQENFVLLRGMVYCLKCKRKRYVRKKYGTSNTEMFICSSISRDLTSCGAGAVSTKWLADAVWREITKTFRNKEAVEELIAMLSGGDTTERLQTLESDRTRLQAMVEEYDQQAQRLVRRLAQIKNDSVVDLIQREITNLTEQLDKSLSMIDGINELISEIEAAQPDTVGLMGLHHQLAWGDENFSDEKKREILENGGLRVYQDGRKFEIHWKDEVRKPGGGLVAHGKMSDCKPSSRSLMTSGRRATYR